MPMRAARIVYKTITAADWRIYIIFGALSLFEVASVPMFQHSTYEHGLQYDTLRKLFSSPLAMVITYSFVGLGCLWTLRGKGLRLFVPIGMILLLFYITNQISSSPIPPYSVTNSTVAMLFMSFAFFKGGGFRLNSRVNPSTGLTRTEEKALEDAEMLKKVIEKSPKKKA